jgi:hypothetical protein
MPVRTAAGVDVRAGDHVVQAALLVADGHEEHVGAGVDEQVDAVARCSLADRGDAIGLLIGRVERIAPGVLEVDADRARVQHAPGGHRELVEGAAIAGLDVGTHRQVDDAGDAGDQLDDLLTIQMVAVGQAEAPGVPAAAGRDRLGAAGGDQPSGAHVPGVGQHDRRVAMQRRRTLLLGLERDDRGGRIGHVVRPPGRSCLGHH